MTRGGDPYGLCLSPRFTEYCNSNYVFATFRLYPTPETGIRTHPASFTHSAIIKSNKQFEYAYLSPSINRIRIAAVSARVAFPFGASVEAERPVIRPLPFAHSIASRAQELMLPASE